MSTLLSSIFSVELLSQVVDIEYRCTAALPFNILTKSPFHKVSQYMYINPVGHVYIEVMVIS